MTDIDWTKPIELETDPPRPAKVVDFDYDGRLYYVRAEWNKGLWDDYPVDASGVMPGSHNYPSVRNIVPATDPRDELIAELVAWLKRCEEMVSTDKGAPDWDMVRAAIAKAEGRS